QVSPPSMVCQMTPSSPTAQPSLASTNWTACRAASSKWRVSAARAGAAQAAPTASASRKGRMRSPLVPDGLGGRREAEVFLLPSPPRGEGRSAFCLLKEPVPDDAEESLNRVLEADLLTLLVRAARVTDRHLVDAPRRVALLGDLGR